MSVPIAGTLADGAVPERLALAGIGKGDVRRIRPSAIDIGNGNHFDPGKPCLLRQQLGMRGVAARVDDDEACALAPTVGSALCLRSRGEDHAGSDHLSAATAYGPCRRNRRHQYLRPQLRRPLCRQRPCGRRPHRQDLHRSGALAARAAAAPRLRPRRRADRARLPSGPAEISHAPGRAAQLGAVRAHLMERGLGLCRGRAAAHPPDARQCRHPRLLALGQHLDAARLRRPQALLSTSSAAAPSCGRTCRPRPRSSPCA